MKRFLLGLLLVVNTALAQIVPGSTGVTTHTMGDDGYVSVPLQFGFPFYGKVFTHSFMFDNGVVGLYDPIGNIGCNPQNGFCGGNQYNAIEPNVNMGSQFHYMIAPLWADIAPNPNTKYYTQGTTTYQRYMWENIHEYYSGGSRLNTFGLELKPSGSIDAYYQLINIETSNTFIGTIGDASKSEWNKIGFHPYGTILNQLPNWSITSTGPNLCAVDPLSSPSCPDYATAYFNQQCTISPLYNSQCPGYADAYLLQQCSSNPLYNQSCPGYATAYLQQQCSINPLYSTTCEGYETAYYNQQCSTNPLYATTCPGYADAYLQQQCSVNPLYSTTCSGYQQAYYNQQCSLNPLYDKGCPGYATAYFNQQCSINPLYATTCVGYEAAYFNQQCSINPLYNQNCTGYAKAYFDQQCILNSLYSKDCPGYATAYFNQQCSLSALYDAQCPGYQKAYYNQQCSINPLYDSGCPGYAQAYFNQQCSLNGLYNQQCPNYSQAYATKQLLEQQSAKTNTTVTTTTTTVTSAPAVDSTGSVTVPVISDPVVNQVVTTTATSASPAQSATATVPLVTVTPAVTTTTTTREDKKDVASTGVSTSGVSQTSTQDTKTETKPTVRQELQAKRESAARAKAVEQGKNLASAMGQVADIETQKQIQNVVIQAMGFTPGFDSYAKVIMIDSVGYKPFTVYNNQRNVDNQRLGWGLYGPSDRLHNEMVQSQYTKD